MPETAYVPLEYLWARDFISAVETIKEFYELLDSDVTLTELAEFNCFKLSESIRKGWENDKPENK